MGIRIMDCRRIVAFGDGESNQTQFDGGSSRKDGGGGSSTQEIFAGRREYMSESSYDCNDIYQIKKNSRNFHAGPFCNKRAREWFVYQPKNLGRCHSLPRIAHKQTDILRKKFLAHG
jgi:hypothetical protein